MPEQLLTILKLCLLALLYLFFLRVLRVVWTEVREPEPVAAPGGSGAGAAAAKPKASRSSRRTRARTAAPRHPTRLAVLAPPAVAGREFALASEMTIGRAPGCTLSVEDSYVSGVHTRVFGRDGSFLVEDLGSTNGTYLNGRKVTGPAGLRIGDRIQLGNVEIEVR